MAIPPAKNNNSLYIKGCLGCFGIFILFILLMGAIGGYVFYLEETALDDHSNEILIVPVVNDGPVDVRIDRRSSGYRQINMWVRGPGLTHAKGTVRCGKSKRQRAKSFDSKKAHYRSKKTGPHKHVWMDGRYLSSNAKPLYCVASFTTLTGIGPFEIVLTQSQRPSERLSF